MFSILLTVLATVSSVRGGAIVDATRDFSVKIDQDVLRLLEPNYNPEDTANLTSRSVIDVLLNRRQSCSPGYGYCSSFGKCCPSTDRCCSYGYCVPPGETCCAPLDAECCGDKIGWCEAGNHCYKVEGLTRDVCCTDSSCTARVTGGTTITVGSGGSGTTPPPVPTPTTTEVFVGYYYFTITWTYYVYYWYYSIAIEASVVTSSVTTTSDSVRVTASNSAAASAAFASISATYSPYTPAAATSLESLAGSTSSASSFSTPTFSAPSFTTPTLGSTSRPFGASGAGIVRVGLIEGDLVGTLFFTGAVAIAVAMVFL